MFIGNYSKSACVTYLGTISSVIGIIVAMKQRIKTAIVCLVISGICDMFDGKIARKEKNRTEAAKNYGVEIDSLSDTICFVVLPTIIFYQMGMNRWYNFVVYILYVLAGIIRLAYFNISTSNSEPIKKYTGLPVTSAAIIMPMVYLMSFIFDKAIYNIIATIIMGVVGVLFISNIKIPKPKGNILYFFLGIAIIFIFLMLI